MKSLLFPLALAGLMAAPSSAQTPAVSAAPALSPGEIVAAAPPGDWVAIAASDLLVMDLTPGAKGKARRVVIQLMPPPFSQGWIGNIRKLAAAKWWDGTSVNRVQDNYVVQWGDASAEDKARVKPLPPGLAMVPEEAYARNLSEEEERTRASENAIHAAIGEREVNFRSYNDPYAARIELYNGWPVASNLMREVDGRIRESDGQSESISRMKEWPIHCYAMVGVGRNLSPDTGSGAELYTVIGHAPRHLDRNIALVGRVIEGIEHLSSLPRGTGALGFYETAEERVPIVSVRMGNEVAGLAAFQYLSTESESFARYADARANRRDAFFIRPAGGADICNIPVPVRRVK